MLHGVKMSEKWSQFSTIANFVSASFRNWQIYLKSRPEISVELSIITKRCIVDFAEFGTMVHDGFTR